MKPLLPLVLLLGATSLLRADSTPATTALPPVPLARTEVRTLPFTGPNRQYQLHVALPESYATEKDRRYPVIFVTDGYWDLPTLHCSYNNFTYDKVVPECILVGLAYAGDNPNFGALRNWDLSPVPVFDNGENSGHAADFLALLEKEIIPLVEREYRADPQHRVLAGSSLGGLFTLYTLFTKPELFEAYIAASPATGIHSDWLFAYEEQFAKSGRPLKARLYMTGAEYEWPKFLDAIKRFDARLVMRRYPELTYQFRIIDGERHAGTKAESYARGMRFVLAPLAPETGPSKDE